MTHPSEQLRCWLEQQVKTLAPGSQLPTGGELACAFGISPRTVARILAGFSNRSEIVRIPGRGTFIPKKDTAPAPVPAEVRSSSDSLAESILGAIARGSFPHGAPLPQIKYLCLRFKVSPATVITAYRHLQERGYVTRIGKTFWVGSFDTLTQKRPEKEVYLFKHHSLDFSDVFSSDMMAQAYRKMERELALSGYLLRFENTDDLAEHCADFARAKRYPYGLIFFRTDPVGYGEIRPHLTEVRDQFRKHHRQPPPIMIDWALGGLFEEIPRSLILLSRGHVSTSCAKAVAEHLQRFNSRTVRVFMDEKVLVWNITSPSPLIKIWNESRHRCPDIRFQVCIRTKKGDTATQEYRSRFASLVGGATIRTQVAKYHDASLLPDLARSLETVGTLRDGFIRPTNPEIWLFTSGADASSALDWCAERNIAVPGKVALFSLENDPVCYHRRISCCDPDWERIGYAMAHALTGMYPVEKTTKGFIRTQARLIERSTT